MSSSSRSPPHCLRQQRSALKQTACTAVSLLLGLAFAFQEALALDRALSAPIIAPNVAPRAYPVPTAALRQLQSRQAVNTTFAECVAAMESSDSNSNSFLSQNEYMSFVNILSDDAFQGQGLANVSTPIRKNFFTLQRETGNSPNGINIAGAGDSSPSDAETANLQNICDNTTAAINEALAPTASPSQPPATATASPQAECFEAMNTADTNGDSMMNQNEYVTFVDILSDGEISVSSFKNLTQPFKSNFWKWSNNTNQIDIFGSKQGQNASTDQTEFLTMMCDETKDALNPAPPTTPSSVAPVVEPTKSPSTPAPTSVAPVDEPTQSPSTPAPSTAPSSVAPVVEPSPSPSTPAPSTAQSSVEPTPSALTPAPTTAGTSATIQSEFTIYNTYGLDANATKNSSAFEDLTLAYSNFAQEIVGTLSTIRRKKQNVLRNPSGQRRLTVDFIDNSAEITSLIDAPCPSGTPTNALCQQASASYRVSMVDEDEAAVSRLYTNETQTAINEGGLQIQLDAINPNSGITIAPPPPTSQPSDSDGLSTGAIAGIAVGGVVVVLGAGVALYYARRSNIPVKKPVGDSSVDEWGNHGEDAEKAKRPSGRDDGVAAGTRPTVEATADDFNKYTDDDYSYESGSFFENKKSASPLQTATTSKDEDYDYSPFEEKKDVKSMKPKPPVPDYSSSSNAGSSGWSSSEEDTDNEGDDQEKEPVNESSGDTDSFFSPQSGSIESKEAPGSISTSASESTSGSSGSESSGSTSTSGSSSTSGSASTSESAEIGPRYDDSGAGNYSMSYADSQFTELSPYSQQKAPVAQGAAVTRMAKDGAVPASDDKPNTAAIAGGVTAGVAGAAAIGALAYAATRRNDSSDSASYTSSDSTYDESMEEASRGSSVPSAEAGATKFIDKSGKWLGSGPVSSKSLATEDLSGSARERVSELDNFVQKGDWDGVIASAKKFEAETTSPHHSNSTPSRSSSSGSSSEGSSQSDSASRSRRSKEEGSSGETGLETSGETGLETSGETGLETSGETGTSWQSTEYTSTTDSDTPEEIERRAEYRAEVEALVRVVVPEEINNVDVMMVQFRGREAELVSTLRNMQERSVAQRARAAVHKSGNQPSRRENVPGQYRRDGNYSTDSRMSQNTEDTHGSAAAGSAAIAAASVPRPAAGGRVPIHLPPLPAHESFASTASGSRDVGRSTSTESDEVPRAQVASDEHTSTSRSRSYDSRSASSGGSGSSSSTSSSGSESESGSSSSGRSSSGDGGSHEKDYGISQETSTNFDSSRETSYETSQSTSQSQSLLSNETSQSTSQSRSLLSDSTASIEGDVKTASRWAERRGSGAPTKLKPWLRAGEQDDDVSEDFDTMGVSVGQFSRRR